MGNPDSLTARIIELSETLNKKLGGGPTTEHVLSHGGFSMLGVDMSRSLGLTDVVPDNLFEAAFPGGGKLAEMAGAGIDMAKNPTEMNAKRLGRAAAPLGVQGWADNAWFTKETDKGDLVVNSKNLRGQAYRNTTDKWAKNFGFTGINESVQKQKTYEVEKLSRDYSDLRQRPLDNMRDQLFADGKIQKETVMQYLKYRGNPDTLETDLTRYAMEQNMSAAELSMLRAASSSAVSSAAKAADYVRMFKNENK
jgi:hypothetical protein